MHDWTRVEAGIYHAFHTAWIGEIQKCLNQGLLPKGYYALAEQHAGRLVSDVLTLHAPEPEHEPVAPMPPDTGGVALAEAPPRVRRKQVIAAATLARRRTVAIRHVSGHRLVALIEIVSPSNKDREESVDEFTEKAVSALRRGVHLLAIDPFPPGPHDPHGMHSAIVLQLNAQEAPYEIPPEEPLTLASYTATPDVTAYVEHMATGAALPEMPLFLRPDRYVNVPLEATYMAAYRGMPEFWRGVLEAPSA